MALDHGLFGNNRNIIDMNNSNQGAQQAPREPSKIWINIGYEKNGKFINLPFGTPLDTMKPAEVRGSNEDWRKFQTARNEFLKALVQVGKNLEPGQDIVIPNLEIRMHRVAENEEIKTEDNEYSIDFSSLLAAE